MTATNTEVICLAKAARLTTAVIQDAIQEASPLQVAFLQQVLEAEVASRTRSKITRLTKTAGFPMHKSLTGFDWTRTTLPTGLDASDLSDADFVNRLENLVLMGDVGTGKTHLACAIGHAACHKGMKVKFTTVAHLVLDLTKAAQSGVLDKHMNALSKLDLLILDEFGYIPMGIDQARLLFQVIADAYENTSVVITTNLPFARWGDILADTQMAAALIERVIHHGHLISFEGSSWRLEHSLMRQGGRHPNLTTNTNQNK